jgi:1-acyl-sn-glycerol-3-phosphate acyltransferase
MLSSLLKPSHEAVKAIRKMLDQAGLLKQMDLFFYFKIEDPLYYLLFTQMYDFKIINDSVLLTEEQGPFLLAVNHQSIMDPLVSGLGVVHNSHRSAWQLTKSEMFDNPIFGNFVAANQTIPINRGENDTAALQRCIDEMLVHNRPVQVYPEGTYGPGDGVLLPFKTGIVRLAWDAQVPVIPMAMYGQDKILPKDEFKNFKTTGKLRVGFGNPLSIAKLFPGKKKGDTISQDEYKAATAIVQAAVQETWNMLAAEFK